MCITSHDCSGVARHVGAWGQSQILVPLGSVQQFKEHEVLSSSGGREAAEVNSWGGGGGGGLGAL